MLQARFQKTVNSQDVQGVLHVIAVAQHAGLDAVICVNRQLVRFVIEHVIAPLMFQHNVHEACQQTVQLLSLQNGTRLAWMHRLADELVNVLR